MDTYNQQVISAVKKWVNAVIVGFNFCPFAKKEVERQTIDYRVSHAMEMADALQDVLDAIDHLQRNEDIETSILIYAEGFTSFEYYLDLVDMANALIAQGGYEGIFQLATFHPDYCFEGEQVTDAANYTNRAPYPCLHLLREASLERAISKHPDPEGIPLRNIELARELGTQKLQQLLNDCLHK